MTARLLLLATITMMSLSLGCGIHQGLRRDADTRNEFQYKMDVTELQYLRTATGSSNILSILCLIPLAEDPYANAMKDLLKNADLKKNEILANYRDDIGITGFPYIYCNQRLTVSADVIQIGPASGSAPAAAAAAAP